jgi:hypothetical protein
MTRKVEHISLTFTEVYLPVNDPMYEIEIAL